MTLPGGAAAKEGHRYEKWWTLSELVRMLRGETDSLRIEPPGLDGVEFVVKSGDRQEFHQAKRSHPSGKWSPAMLSSAGVLRSIGQLLIGNRDRFVFVSGSDARELADLCEAANSAESVEEFTGKFLKAQTRKRIYRKLLEEWKCDTRNGLDVLCRIDVRTVNDRELEEKVRWGLSALFLANPDRVLETLFATINGAVHRTITRDDLVSRLVQSGYSLRELRAPHDSRKAVFDATDKYLRGVRGGLIQDSLIPRNQTSDIVARLTGEHPSYCVLTGQAGAGKTGCVMEVVERLRATGVQVLAFRLDRHMAATSTTDLGQQLDLEESPALVLSAAAKADDTPAVLIIDQLDAVSAMSGRGSDAFDIVERLLVEAKDASVGALVVCRVFDWRNDPRLRNLIREDDREINLDGLSLDDVRDVLDKTGFSGNAFSHNQLDLLRLPQNLSLFLNANFSSMTFSTTSDLLRHYWNEKRTLVGQRAEGTGDQWVDVIGAMCEAMDETQKLSVRMERLDRFSPTYLAAFVSEGVFAKDGHSYAFGHESFFDYCFARLFVNKEESLTTLLKSSEQHLFRRSQVRQVLVYLREADFGRYLRELEALVRDEAIRPHIRDLTLALLASLDSPRDEEWNVWRACVDTELAAIEHARPCRDRVAWRAWQRIFFASSWFQKFHNRGEITRWLNGHAQQADLAADYLRFHQRAWPDNVAEYLEPFIGRDDKWRRRLKKIMLDPGACRSRRHFDLFLRLLDDGTLGLDGNSGDLLQTVYYQSQDQRSEWIPEILAHVLRRYRHQMEGSEAAAHGGLWRFGLTGGNLEEILDKAAKRHPRSFVRDLLPAVLELSEAAPKSGSEPPVRDAVWPYLMKSTFSLADSCLAALTEALGKLADADADLRKQIDRLACKETYVANHLLLAIYRRGARRYADEAALAFCDRPWRFHCGYSDSSYWCATETLREIVRYCTVENLAKLESTVLAYLGPYEKTKEGVRRRGWAAFNLLAAIPDERRSGHARRRFHEWQRKFRNLATAPKEITTEIVGPPIAPEKLDQMNDDHWLSAIAAYPSEYPTTKDRLRGGAIELAQAFGNAAQHDPERFAQLGLQLLPATNPLYFCALLRGLAGTAADVTTKLKVCRRAFDYAGVACGSEIADLLAKVETPLPEHALGMLTWLAVSAEDLEEEERWRKDTGESRFGYGGDIYANGINTTRGRSVLAMGELILRDGSYIRRLETTLDELVQVRTAAVSSCVAHMLRAVAYHDITLGTDLFLRMDFGEERLLGTRHVYEFIRENMYRGFGRMRDLIVRGLRSPHPDVSRAGARLGCIAGLSNQDALALAHECQQGNIHQRLGSVEVAAANVGESKCRKWCEDALKVFFNDPEPEIRKVAASCFRHISEDDLVGCEGLIEVFCNSPAHNDDAFFLLNTLKNARASLPGVTCLACERLLKRSGARHLDTGTVSELVFRLYQQHPNDEWTKRALDLVDRLCLEAPADVSGSLEDFER